MTSDRRDEPEEVGLEQDVVIEVPLEGDDAPASGATDAVGMAERIARSHTTVDIAASGADDGIPLEEARQQLRDAQSALVALGYSLGSDDVAAGIDGTFGPETRDAVAAFQDEHDLTVTGRLDADTYEALMAGYEQAVETQGRGENDDFDPLPGLHSVE